MASTGGLRISNQKDEDENSPVQRMLRAQESQGSRTPVEPKEDSVGDESPNVSSTGGFYHDKGESPSGLKTQEESVGEDEEDDEDSDGFYSPGNSSSTGKRKARFRISRRQAATGGGIAGLVIGGGFWGLSIVSGPAVFVDIAQLFTRFHFSPFQDASDNRLSKIARYIRDPSKPQNTRMGIVGNKVANRLEKKMNASGIESAYTDKLGYFDGYFVDVSNENFDGKSPAQIKKELVTKYGLDPGSLQDATIDGKRTIKIDGKGLSYRSTLRLNRQMLSDVGYSKVVSSVGARIMGKRAGITWHPIRRADQTILQGGVNRINKLKERFRQTQAEEIKNGSTTIIDANGNKQEVPKDGNGNPDTSSTQNANEVDGEIRDNAAAAADAAQGVNEGKTDSVSKFQDHLGLKLAGGVAGVAGVACIANGLNSHVNEIRQAQVTEPLMRIGMELVAVGNQVMSGQDISARQLGFYHDEINKIDSNGKTVSTWNQAKSVQAELGQPQTGPDIPDSAKVYGKGNPFDFINPFKSVLNPVCSALGTTAGQAFGFILSGGPLGALAGIGINEALKPALSTIAHWAAGDAVDPFVAGADRGNYANYGVRLAANDQAVAAGGSELTNSEESAVKLASVEADRTEFHTKSLAYRLFNTYDSQSLVAGIIMGQSPGAKQNLDRMATGFAGIFSSVLKIPGSLISGVTHAAASSYDYGFPAYGFSRADLENPNVQNPFANAKAAASLLDSANGTQYIEKASKCFGVSITKGADGAWDVNGGDRTTNLYDKNAYDSYGCGDRSADWITIRFFIFDTETMESYDCYDGSSDTSDQSCANVGFSSASAATTATSGSSSIDTTHLHDDSSNIKCADGTTDVGVETGYADGSAVKIRLCAIPGLHSTGEESTPGTSFYVNGADGNALVNSRVSSNFLALYNAGKAAGIPMGANSSFRTMAHQQALCSANSLCASGTYSAVARPGTSNHQMGLAIDFKMADESKYPLSTSSCINIGGVCSAPGDKVWEWLTKHSKEYGLQQYVREYWHFSPDGK